MRVPKVGGVAYMSGFQRNWNPFFSRSKRAAWYEQFDRAKDTMENREPARLLPSEPSREELNVISRLHAVRLHNASVLSSHVNAVINEQEDNSGPLAGITLSSEEIEELHSYISRLKGMVSDYTALGEVTLNKIHAHMLLEIELKRVINRLRRNRLRRPSVL